MTKRILLTVLMLTTAAVLPHGASLKDFPQQNTEQRQRKSATDPGASSWFETAGAVEDVREEFHQTYPLSPNGRVLLDNVNGNVKIGVWDRSEVQVDAVKRANSKERLAEAIIDVNATADVLRIRTRYPQRDSDSAIDAKGRYNNPAVVEYTLTVPRQARLESIELVNGSIDIVGVEGDVKASSVNGRIIAQGLSGEARLQTVNGTVEATFLRLNEAKGISLGSVNGDVALVIPSNANAVVRAETVHGKITNEFGLEVRHGDYVGHELYGQIGTGGPRIKLGNVNGAIHIRHSQDGAALSSATNLISVSERDKEKDKDKDRAMSEAVGELRKQSREIAAEARRAAREALAEERAEARAQADTRREVDRALVEAQREIERAQLQVQREVRQQLREQVRQEARSFGKGEGRGVGEGRSRVTDRETKSFTVSGTPRVNLSTFDGLVTIRGWDKPEVMYTATKRAANNEALKSIEIKTDQQGSSVSIIADAGEEDGTVDLEVFLPRNASLHASSGDGRLVLDGVSGDLTLRTGDGSIEVINSKGTVKVNTGDGPIKITGFDGQVEARTGDGPISLNGSFTALTARTGSGSVTLAVPAGANFTLETNAEEVMNEGLTISEDATPSRRVKRWKVGQGGKVFVVNTGEGRVFLRLN